MLKLPTVKLNHILIITFLICQVKILLKNFNA